MTPASSFIMSQWIKAQSDFFAVQRYAEELLGAEEKQGILGSQHLQLQTIK